MALQVGHRQHVHLTDVKIAFTTGLRHLWRMSKGVELIVHASVKTQTMSTLPSVG